MLLPESRITVVPSLSVVFLNVLLHHPRLSKHEGPGDGSVRRLNRFPFGRTFSGDGVKECTRFRVNASTSLYGEGEEPVVGSGWVM